MNSTPSTRARAKGRLYDETFRVPAGALCLDFCNTGQAMRDWRGTEWLTGFTDLVDWLEAAGAMSHAHARRLGRAAEASPGVATAAWRRALILREALFRVFDAAARGEAAASMDLDHIATTYARTLASGGLEWSDKRYAWRLGPSTTSLLTLMHPIIGSAVELMTSEQLSRLRRCGSASCHWLFLDETRNHSRRWCEMASCGNLAKVRRHREKGRAAKAC
jgi:predicted RNA-binding Zn ribbon-like protein